MTESAPAELVVVVEDDPAIADGLALNLKLQGYGTEVAGDGEVAVSLIRELHPDLVLLDISLPKRSGIWVLQTLRDAGDHDRGLGPSALRSARHHLFAYRQRGQRRQPRGL